MSDVVSEPAVPQPAAQDAPPAKKRRSRVPKVKPPRKPRVTLGPIRLCAVGNPGIVLLASQPPAGIANDVIKVSRWAAEQEPLQMMQKAGQQIRMIREYNVSVKITTKVVASSEIVLDDKTPEQEEVPQKP